MQGLSLANFTPPDAQERLDAARWRQQIQRARSLGLTLRCRYDLYATVNHMGSIDGGHYVAHMQVKHARTFTRSLSPGSRTSLALCMLTSAAADGQQLVLR